MREQPCAYVYMHVEARMKLRGVPGTFHCFVLRPCFSLVWDFPWFRWLASKPCTSTLLCHSSVGISSLFQNTWLLKWGFWESNSGPHDCVVGTLLSKVSPQPWDVHSLWRWSLLWPLSKLEGNCMNFSSSVWGFCVVDSGLLRPKSDYPMKEEMIRSKDSQLEIN